MTETDWAGLFREAHGAAWADGTGDAFHAAGEYLRTRIEAAFVPVEHHTAVITDHDELLQHEIARAEAAEARVKVLEEALRECRDQLWHLAKDPASNPWIKQADDALGGEHAG